MQSKWYTNYVEGVNLENIEWKRFNYNDLIRFFYQSYYDEDYEAFVMTRDENNNFLPYGMTYLSFTKLNQSDEYLIGLVGNKQGLKTIACCIIFKSKYLVEHDSIKPVTYIDTVETNKFFQNRGLFTKMVRNLPQFIDTDQDILITPEEGMGRVIGVNSIIKRVLIEQGFAGDIRSEYEIDEEYLMNLKKTKTKIK